MHPQRWRCPDDQSLPGLPRIASCVCLARRAVRIDAAQHHTRQHIVDGLPQHAAEAVHGGGRGHTPMPGGRGVQRTVFPMHVRRLDRRRFEGQVSEPISRHAKSELQGSPGLDLRQHVAAVHGIADPHARRVDANVGGA